MSFEPDSDSGFDPVLAALPAITRAEVLARVSPPHNEDLVAIDGVVYDVSAFLDSHPGDALPFLRHSRSGVFPDATSSFYAVHPEGMELLRKYRSVVRPIAIVKDPMLQEGDKPWPAKVVDPAKVARPPHPKIAPGLLRRAVIEATGLAWDGAGLLASSVYWSLIRPLELMSRSIFPVTGAPVRADGRATRVGIIGGGASGLSCAWTLDQTEGFDFTVFEKQARVGGHAHTVMFDLNEEPEDDNAQEPEPREVAIDLGFIFGNERSYSNLLELMSNVGAKPTLTELSVSADVNGQKWCTSASHCTGMTGETHMHPEAKAECLRFHAMCERLSENPALNVFPFDKLLDMMGFTKEWREIYLSPLLSILFLDTDRMYKTSARFLCNIFGGKNKFMDLLEGQEAFTVSNGTRDTWERVQKCFPDKVITGCGVQYVQRQPAGTVAGENGDTVLVVLDDGTKYVFDHVVMCLNARAAGLLLERGQTMTSKEKLFFSQMRYNTENLFLHTDYSFLPSDPSMTRNFNYVDTPEMEHPQLTGSMLHVANHPEGALAPNGVASPGFRLPVLTATPTREVDKEKIVKEWWGSLHVQDLRHIILTRLLLPACQGNGGIFFGGSWTNWMGHSGAVDAGMCVAVRLGANYPFTNILSRTEFFNDCCQDMFGPRFAWTKSVREYKPGRSPSERAANIQAREEQMEREQIRARL